MRSPLRSPALTVCWSSMAIVALCLSVGLPTVRSDNYFLGDDFGLVQHLHDLPFQRLLSYFISDWTEGIYGATLDELRPFLAFSYWLDARLFGAVNAAGYHVTNVVLHTLNALLVLAIARAAAPGQTAFPVLAAALFAVMPSHAEPVSWISGRVDSLSGLFYLGAFLCFVRFRRRHEVGALLAALIIFTCGLFVKQSLVTFPLLIVAFDVCGPVHEASARGRTFSRIWTHAPFFVVLAMYLTLRQQLFGNAVREGVLDASVVTEFAFRQFFYALNLLPTAAEFSIASTGVVIGVLALCAVWLLHQREKYPWAVRRALFFGPLWYAITIIPMVVTYPSARHLYVTSAGLALAVASLILPGRLAEDRQWKGPRLVMAAIVVILSSTALLAGNDAWIKHGIESGNLVTRVSRMLGTLPPGRVVVIDVPQKSGSGSFWTGALPFALQKPFVADNMYDRFTFVEYPRVYCCPHDWWAVKKRTLVPLMDSPAPTLVSYIRYASDDPGMPRLETRTIDGLVLRRRIESAIGRPVESFSSRLKYEEGNTVLEMLVR